MSIERTDVGPILSRMVETEDTVYLAGLVADDATQDIEGQTRQVLAKIDGYLAQAGTDKSKLLTALIFVSKLSLRPRMNEVWTRWIDLKNPPARACVGAELSGNVQVEIMVTARK
jgi:enamine deaminase RidA (YjgF/YER057c/UK114 family)